MNTEQQLQEMEQRIEQYQAEIYGVKNANNIDGECSLLWHNMQQTDRKNRDGEYSTTIQTA